LNFRGNRTLQRFAVTRTALSALTEAQQDIWDENALVDPNALGYVTTPSVAKTLKNRPRFTSTDTPLWQGPLHDGEIEGVLAIASKQIATDEMLFGDWSALVIPEWAVPAVELNPYASFRLALWVCGLFDPSTWSCATRRLSASLRRSRNGGDHMNWIDRMKAERFDDGYGIGFRTGYQYGQRSEQLEAARRAELMKPPPRNPPELLAATRCKVRPFCVAGRCVEVGEIATVDAFTARSLAAVGKCELL
jgi:hypothetical protein